MRARTGRRARRAERGFTLLELMVAMGILMVFSLFLVRFLTTSLGIWRWGEERSSLEARASVALATLSQDWSRMLGLRTVGLGRRIAMEQATSPGTARLYADLEAYARTGKPADPKSSWEEPRRFDWYPRERFVIRLGEAESRALLEAEVGRQVVEARGQMSPAELAREVRATVAEALPSDVGEVLLRVVPVPDEDSPYLALYRDVRRIDAQVQERWVDGAELPEPGQPVLENLLYVDLAFRSQLTETWDPAQGGAGPERCWDSARAGTIGTTHDYLRFSLDLDAASLGDPLDDVLPSSVRILCVVDEGPEDATTALLETDVDEKGTDFKVSYADRLPPPDEQAWLKLGKEWIRYSGVIGDRLTGVRRGQRGTAARPHRTGTRIHAGKEVKLVLPLSVAREYWNG
ncbi:MAG: prepilin-type N-terminal cleavage/methylation domain-containing protein [Planctomycetota bacterium]